MFIAQHSRSGMFLASREVPHSERHSAKSNGAAPLYKWVWKQEDAKRFPAIRDAETAIFFVGDPPATFIQVPA